MDNKFAVNPLLAQQTSEDATRLGTLISLVGDEAAWLALKWYATRAAQFAAGEQLKSEVTTNDGIRNFYLWQGRRQGVWDMITTIEEELSRRQKQNNTVSNLTTEPESTTHYGY